MLEQYKLYTKFLKAEIKALDKCQKNHPNAVSTKRFKTPYNLMFFHLFCDNMEQYDSWVNGGMFPDNAINTKEYLENYFNIQL